MLSFQNSNNLASSDKDQHNLEVTPIMIQTKTSGRTNDLGRKHYREQNKTFKKTLCNILERENRACTKNNIKKNIQNVKKNF